MSVKTWFWTETGSEYELSDNRLLRLPDHAGDAMHNGLRGDGQRVEVLEVLHLQLGDSARFLLTGLAESGPTIRTTSRVVEITTHEENE